MMRNFACRALAFIALFHCVALPSGGTSIVAILNSQVVVIAADSKGVNTETGKVSAMCKIHVGDGFSWATAGLTKDYATGWNPDVYIEQNPNIARLDGTLPKQLQREAEALSPKARKATESILLEFLLIGFKDGKVTVSHREYKPIWVNGKVSIARNSFAIDCPGKDCKEPQMFIMGARDAAEAYIKRDPDVMGPSFLDASMDRVVKLVKMEIDTAPAFVGPPINTASIDQYGLHWGEHNGPCPSAKAKLPTKPRATDKRKSK